MGWPLAIALAGAARCAHVLAATCSATSSPGERELCLRVKQSADGIRSRHGRKGGVRSQSSPTEVEPLSPKGGPAKKPKTLAVVLPVVPRKHGAELAYVQRSVPALMRELANYTLHVLVFGEKGEAASSALHLLKALPARFQARRKHKQLKDPSKLKNAFGDSQEKLIWRSRLVLDFVSAARAANLSSAPESHMLWLEEDVELLPGFGRLLEDWLRAEGERKDWLVLRLLGFQRDPDQSTWKWGTAGWGGGGTLLYNGKHLHSYLDFLEANFDAAPLDWLHRAMAPASAEWWNPQLEPVLLRHCGEHSTHENFL